MLKRIISAVIIGATLAVFLLQSTSALTKSEYEQYEKKGVITKLLQSGAIDDIIATHATQNYGQLGEILLAYDYINGTKRFSEFLTAKKNYFAEFKKADDKEIFTDSTNERFDIEVKKSHKTLSFLPKTMLDDGHWAFVYNGLKNDKTFVSNVKQISKDV